MIATPTYEYIRYQLKKAFRTRYPQGLKQPIRLTGVFFGRPEGKIAKEEVVPHLNYFNLRSGGHIDFFCAGYGANLPETLYPDRKFVIQLAKTDCYFSDRLFDELRREISSRTKWRYSGGADLILANAKYDVSTHQADLDFSTSITINLDQAKADGLFLSTDMLFEKIFDFAESQSGDDPAWGLSDHLGLRVVGSALKSVLLTVLPEATRSEVKKALHLYAKDINR